MKIKKFIKNIISNIPIVLLLLNKKRILKPKKWIKKSYYLYNILHFICPFFKLNYYLNGIEYKTEKSLSISKNLNKSDLINEYLELFEFANNELKLYIIKVMFSANLFDKDMVKYFFDKISVINDVDIKYWFALDISILTFSSPDFIYDEYYIDRRKLLKSIAVQSKLTFDLAQRDNNEESVCIITYLLSDSIKNSLQRVSMMVASGIGKQIKKISIVSLQSFFPKGKGAKFSFFGPVKNEKKKKEIINMFPNNKVYFAEGKTPKENMQSALDIISQINPSIIIDLSDEHSPTSYLYSNKMPTLYIPMRNYASSSFFNYIVGKKWRFDLVNQEYHSIDDSQIVDWFFPEYVPPKSHNISKKELGFSNNQKIIVTVGNNSKSCNNEFVDMMAKLLNRNDTLVWLLIGSDGPQYLHIKYEHLLNSNKIVEYGYTNNLSGIYSACDILIRPNTTGGSGATAIAAMQGLPIVMTSFICDAMRWLNLDFTKNKTYDDLYDEVLLLINDKEYYKERSQLSLELVRKATDADTQWNKLVEIIRDIERKNGLNL